MAKLGRELRASGVDVIDLSLGEPDFDTPQHIKDGKIVLNAAPHAVKDFFIQNPDLQTMSEMLSSTILKIKVICTT